MSDVNVVDTAINVVKTFVEALVDNKDVIKVEAKTGDRMISIDISADKNDIGKIIGKNGRTITSLRTLIQVIVANQNKRVNIVVLD